MSVVSAEFCIWLCKQRSLMAESRVAVLLPVREEALGFRVVVIKLLGCGGNGRETRFFVRAAEGLGGLGDLTDDGHNGTRGDLGIFPGLFHSIESFHDLRLKGIHVHRNLGGFDVGSAYSINVGLELGLNLGLEGGLNAGLGLGLDGDCSVGLSGGVAEWRGDLLGGLNFDGLGDGGGKGGDESDSHGSRSWEK